MTTRYRMPPRDAHGADPRITQFPDRVRGAAPARPVVEAVSGTGGRAPSAAGQPHRAGRPGRLVKWWLRAARLQLWETVADRHTTLTQQLELGKIGGSGHIRVERGLL